MITTNVNHRIRKKKRVQESEAGTGYEEQELLPGPIHRGAKWRFTIN